jgi:hypothetical protein
MDNKSIECVQCLKEFDFSVSEQMYYDKRGFDEPKRCPDCRRHRAKSDDIADIRTLRDKKKHFRLKYERLY